MTTKIYYLDRTMDQKIPPDIDVVPLFDAYESYLITGLPRGVRLTGPDGDDHYLFNFQGVCGVFSGKKPHGPITDVHIEFYGRESNIQVGYAVSDEKRPDRPEDKLAEWFQSEKVDPLVAYSDETVRYAFDARLISRLVTTPE